MKINKYDIILAILIIANIVLCIYVGISISKDQNFCTTGSTCNDVRSSIYGTLFGLKLVWFGVICFSILLILFLIARFNKKLYWMFFLASILGAGFAIYFISLQLFVLKKICIDCVITDAIAILTLIIVIFEYLDFKKDIKKIEKEVVSEIKKI